MNSVRIVLNEKKDKFEEMNKGPLAYAVLYRTGEFIGIFTSESSAYRAAATRMLKAHSFYMRHIYKVFESECDETCTRCPSCHTLDGDKLLQELNQLYAQEKYETVVEHWNDFFDAVYDACGVTDDEDVRIDVETQPLLP